MFAVSFVSACGFLPSQQPPQPVAVPRAMPAPNASPIGQTRVTPSQDSTDLALYYRRLQADQLTQGLLRIDGGGPDTPYDVDILARNFERIALSEEYERGAGLTLASEEAGPIKKWQRPVRVAVAFGGSVSPAARAQDSTQVERFAARLARVTSHPISFVTQGANFHVLFMGQDDRHEIEPRIRALVPDIDARSLSVIRDLPRSIHCLVVAFSDRQGGNDYAQAIALIRSEHPDLLRLSCIHEEMAQGLGLANDSPYARPSIFNDDDEFALLTSHDEALLRILYDPRLTPGMDAATARPIVKDIATGLMDRTN